MIYVTQKDPTITGENKKYLHHRVSLNTQPWDSHPYASPEGPGTTPYVGLLRWPKTRPPGAAMRLTALRQPKESPKLMTRTPKNSRPKLIPKLPDPSNQTTPHENVSVLPTPGKTRRGDDRGGQYDPAASCASTFITHHTRITNNATPTLDPDSPHNASRILESKDMNGRLRRPARAG